MMRVYAGSHHNCSYYCTRSLCIELQRNELRERLEKLVAESIKDHFLNARNARLADAASEMLEALKRVKETGVFLGAIPQGMVDAAIAKALPDNS